VQKLKSQLFAVEIVHFATSGLPDFAILNALIGLSRIFHTFPRTVRGTRLYGATTLARPVLLTHRYCFFIRLFQ